MNNNVMTRPYIDINFIIKFQYFLICEYIYFRKSIAPAHALYMVKLNGATAKFFGKRYYRFELMHIASMQGANHLWLKTGFDQHFNS